MREVREIISGMLFHWSMFALLLTPSDEDADFSRAPRAFELYPPLDAHVDLTPTSFRADFH